MDKIKLNPHCLFWYPIEIDLVKYGYEQKKSFQEIADNLNKLRKLVSDNGSYMVRTSGAVAYQLNKLGLIPLEEINSHYINKKKKAVEDRHRNLPSERKRVFERDMNKCVFCDNSENLEFCHIIPFRESRINSDKEAITLCSKHHKQFDKGVKRIIEFIFNKMSCYYSDYNKSYEFKEIFCNSCNKWHYKINKITDLKN